MIAACLAKPLFLIFLPLVPAAILEEANDNPICHCERPRGAKRSPWVFIAAPLFLLLLYFLIPYPPNLAGALIPAGLGFSAQPIVWGKILELFLMPVRLGFFYGPELVAGWGPVQITLLHLLAGIALFAILFLFVSGYRRWGRRWFVPGMWLALGMVGLTWLPKNELLAEWRLYPLLPPLALAAGGAIDAALERVRVPSHAVAAVFLLLIAAAGIVTWRHNHAWQSEAKAWEAFSRANPESLSLQFNHASALAEEGRFEEAQRLYEELLARWGAADKTGPAGLDVALVGRTWSALGWIALKEDRPASAVASFREALTWDPAWTRGWRGLGKGLAALGERERGMQAETMISFIKMEMAK